MQLIKRCSVLGLWVLGLALGAVADAASAQRVTGARGASAADRKLQALYSELLGVEMGMYATPYDRFGMLNYQIWRAVRLVVDTGVHSQGWTREQAVDYMREYTALAEHEINTEVDRFIAEGGVGPYPDME
jgi:hypothetical protein